MFGHLQKYFHRRSPARQLMQNWSGSAGSQLSPCFNIRNPVPFNSEILQLVKQEFRRHHKAKEFIFANYLMCSRSSNG
jgi:hypothetical protein